MTHSTRRGFVKSSAATAAGMTVIGALMAEQADAEAPSHGGPVVAYVRDARSGEVALMHGERQVKVHDRKLAARITRAAR